MAMIKELGQIAKVVDWQFYKKIKFQQNFKQGDFIKFQNRPRTFEKSPD